MNRAHLIPTNLPDHFTFEPAPEGFNPLRGSAEDLERYGIVHRPDPKQTPHAARHWRRAMGRVNKFIIPQMSIRPGIARGLLRNWQPVESPAGAFPNGTSNVWSGRVVTDDAPFPQVWGTWTIPAVQGSPEHNTNLNCAAWVGLGGVMDTNLFQAGTELDVGADGTPDIYAWVQWFPSPLVAVPNFPVAAGQTITVYVGDAGDGSGQGVFAMANLSTGVAIPMTAVPIPTVDGFGNPITPALTGVSGTSAEWIVERPGLGPGNDAPMVSQLSDYTELNMTNAAALSGQTVKTEVTAEHSDANAISVVMLDDAGNRISFAEDEMAVHFVSFGANFEEFQD